MNWETAVVIVLAVHTALKAIRDAVDKTPETDDNAFEKAMTFLSKIVGYIAGKRA